MEEGSKGKEMLQRQLQLKEALSRPRCTRYEVVGSGYKSQPRNDWKASMHVPELRQG